ncbi:hypothetical protein CGLO_11172 [Colletotrichum gloeosporioides Cg-14]|jgi:hypothetical protein
MHVT